MQWFYGIQSVYKTGEHKKIIRGMLLDCHNSEYLEKYREKSLVFCKKKVMGMIRTRKVILL